MVEEHVKQLDRNKFIEKYREKYPQTQTLDYPKMKYYTSMNN